MLQTMQNRREVSPVGAQGVVVLDIPTLLEIGAIGRVMELIDDTVAKQVDNSPAP